MVQMHLDAAVALDIPSRQIIDDITEGYHHISRIIALGKVRQVCPVCGVAVTGLPAGDTNHHIVVLVRLNPQITYLVWRCGHSVAGEHLYLLVSALLSVLGQHGNIGGTG